MKLTFLALFSFLSIILIARNKDIDKTKQAKEWFNNQPLVFIENKGQFTDSEGNPATNVLFRASYGNCDIYITTDGLSYVFVKYDKVKGRSIDTNDIRSKIGKKGMENKTASYYRLDMNLQGAAINKTQIIKELPGKQGVINYFYPTCPEGIYGVQEYGKITIKNIYKGIDWVIYTNAGNKESPLKYDFVVQPLANYKDIKIKFVNAQSTSLADNGTKLKIQTIAGNIEEGNLYSYQQNSNEKQAIKTNYAANADSTLEFEIGAYDKTKTLVIDPLVWATYYGGSGDDLIYSICTDNKDNLYISGNVGSSDYPTLQRIGAYWQATKKGDTDAFIVKFDRHGMRQWATFYGGRTDDESRSIYADIQGNIILTGMTDSPDFPTQTLPGAYNQTIIGGYEDVFILKFNSQGQRQWATFYGGKLPDVGYAISEDSQQNIYVTGATVSFDFPLEQLAGAYNQSAKADGNDGFILKFDRNGIRKWATFYGGNWYDDFYALSIDTQDNVYFTGRTMSTDFPTQKLNGSYWQDTKNIIYNAKGDVFILKIDKQGKTIWATCYAGNDEDYGTSMCLDSYDNIYITGYSRSFDFPTKSLPGAFYQSYGDGGGAYLLKFTSKGECIWATYFGGLSNNYGNGVICDKKKNIYLTGWAGENFRVYKQDGEYWQPIINNSDDAYIVKFDSLGTLKWSTYYGGTGYDSGLDLALDSKNSIYIGGVYREAAYTLDYGSGAYYDSIGDGSYDGFIIKLSDCNNQKTKSVQTDRNNICDKDIGFITLTAIGGVGDTLKWYSGGCGLNSIGKGTTLIIPSPTQTSTYYARWESLCDTSECDSVVINIFSQITKNISPVICQGDTCTVGMSKYTKTGIYTDLLPTLSGCDSTIITNLVVNPAKQTAQSPVICMGDIITVGTNTYSKTGTYTDHLKTYLGCDSTVLTNLTVNPTKQTPLTRSICQGESFIVGTKTHTTTGIYSDTLSTVLFCDSIVTTNLSVNATYQPTTFPFACPGETITVGIHVYSSTGTYIDKLPTMFGCDSVITTNLTIYPLLQSIQFPEICTGESLAVGANKYTETGTYTDVLKGSHNCDSTVTTNLTVNPTIRISQSPAICEGESFAVGTQLYTIAGIYTDVLKTYLNCDSTVITNLTVNPLPVVSLGEDILICKGDSVVLSPGPGFSSYLWSDGSVLSDLIITRPGIFSVTAFNKWCPATDEISINECGAEIWFPNAFSPDNDGINERFRPIILGTLSSYQIIIYNRWGQELYESNDSYAGWDGKFQGSTCAAGQYVYIVKFAIGTSPATPKKRVKRGLVTLIK